MKYHSKQKIPKALETLRIVPAFSSSFFPQSTRERKFSNEQVIWLLGTSSIVELANFPHLPIFTVIRE